MDVIGILLILTLILIDILLILILILVSYLLICISLITSDVKHLFMCLMSTCISLF